MSKKVELSPRTLMMPLPAALVTCDDGGSKPNIIAISWIGIVCSEPPMLSISIRKNRHSYAIVKKAGEFVVNLTSEDNLKAVDFCGTKSGRDYDKFKETNLTAVKGKVVKSPLLDECPINLECRVKQSYLLGSHEMFIAEIVAVHIGEEYLDEKGRPDIDKIKPLAYCTGASEYRGGLSRLYVRPNH